MMKRYIDADELINELSHSTLSTWGKGLGTSWWSQAVKLKDNMVECIKKQPTADVEEVKHGHWIPTPYSVGINKTPYECSRCGMASEMKYEYCNCGAKMDEGRFKRK